MSTTLRTKELYLDKRLHDIQAEAWDYPPGNELDKLKTEEYKVKKELADIRLKLYGGRHGETI